MNPVQSCIFSAYKPIVDATPYVILAISALALVALTVMTLSKGSFKSIVPFSTSTKVILFGSATILMLLSLASIIKKHYKEKIALPSATASSTIDRPIEIPKFIPSASTEFPSFEELFTTSLFTQKNWQNKELDANDFERQEHFLKRIGSFQPLRDLYENIYSQELAYSEQILPFPDQPEFVHTTSVQSANKILTEYKTDADSCHFFEQPFFSASLHQPGSSRILYRRENQNVALVVKVPSSSLLLVGQFDLESPQKRDISANTIQAKQSYVLFHSEFAPFREFVKNIYDKANLPKTHHLSPMVPGWVTPPKTLIQLHNLKEHYKENPHLDTKENFILLFSREPKDQESISSHLEEIFRKLDSICLANRDTIRLTRHFFSKPEKILRDTVTTLKVEQGKIVYEKMQTQRNPIVNEAIVVTHAFGDRKVQLKGLMVSSEELSQEEKELVALARECPIPVFYEKKLRV